MKQQYLTILKFIGLSCLLSSKALAGEFDAYTPSAYVQADGGYSVYKSKLLQANDTSTTVGYGFGINAGTDRNVGMRLTREQSSFSFALNASSLQVSWQDLAILWRFGPVYLGGVVATSSWTAKAPPDADGDEILDIGSDAQDLCNFQTSGYGATLGGLIPVGKRSALTLDITSASGGTAVPLAYDPTLTDADTLNGRKVALGTRTEFAVGGSLALTRSLLDLTAGFKMRNYAVSLDSTSYAEQLTTTYLGLRTNFTF